MTWGVVSPPEPAVPVRRNLLDPEAPEAGLEAGDLDFCWAAFTHDSFIGRLYVMEISASSMVRGRVCVCVGLVARTSDA